jgi:NCS1 family nucleobase:cation symporter-1
MLPADITRYARRPRDQIIGQLAIAPWSATLVVLLGIVSASCTQKIYGEALWNPAAVLEMILAEDNSSKTKFAVFCCSFIFVVGQIGTNFAANLIPFGVDSSSLAPRYINIVRGQILCAFIGGWAVVPWKVLVSGTVFVSCITGMGIFMGTLVGIMLADYFFICKGNYFVADLYSSNPRGRYWYTYGVNWRAYVAYISGIALPFPGFLGQLGVKSMAKPLNAGAQIYDLGYLVSFLTSMVIYVVLCKISPPKHVAEASGMAFEYMCDKEVLMGEVVRNEEAIIDEENIKLEMGAKI